MGIPHIPPRGGAKEVHRLAGVAVEEALVVAQGGGVLLAEELAVAGVVVVRARAVVVPVLVGDKVTLVSGRVQVLRGGRSSL